MLVIAVKSCPPKLRGDLTKWLFEIDTGVFVGNLNARVRDAVWERVCENIGNGRAVMVFSTNGEQKLDFRIFNTDWEPVDYDGIKLVRRRFYNSENAKGNISKAEQQHINRIVQRNRKPLYNQKSYTVIDIETTGSQDTDKIIEIGALYVEDGKLIRNFTALLECCEPLPQYIIELTGITDELLRERGMDVKEAIEKFREFCGDTELVGYNINFDIKFLQRDFLKNGMPLITNKIADAMHLARRKIECDSYTLTSVADCLGIKYNAVHRALNDCFLTYEVFEKLKNF
ncbi:MAG: type I-E CRISPR-associated endoribonuclease Cas2 [Synergistaceae bacterium]|nr:type I-E CRISPR-associated endoribonuclease Cas2 [Synergistaceae bacterium]